MLRLRSRLRSNAGEAGPTFAPTDLSGLEFWLDANRETYSDAGVTPNTAGSVYQWKDDARSAYVAQATSTRRPVLAQNVINGKPAISFDGTDDWMSFVGVAGVKTLFAVYRLNNANQTITQVIGGSSGSFWEYALTTYSDGASDKPMQRWYFNSAWRTGAKQQDTNFHYVAMQADGTRARVWIDGVLDLDYSASIVGADGSFNVLGALRSGTSRFCNFTVAEMFGSTNIEDTNTIAGANAYMKAKYDL